MRKILTIIGARPQIIKSAAISRAIRTTYADRVREVIVHTGQHYDRQMSAVFFEELQIPLPDYNLQVGSGKHGEQTAKMISGIEAIIETEQPDFLILYGDTNSTLAGAIAAAKLHTPIVHIEAGLRSFNKRMPEEVNRILSDHVSTYLFPPTRTSLTNLLNEGFRTDNQAPYTIDNPGVFLVGDVMYDNSLYFSSVAAERTAIVAQRQLSPDNYILATLHRNNNTDEAERLNAIFDAMQTITRTYSMPLVMPLHPRTRKQMDALLTPELYDAVRTNPYIQLIEPVSFLEMTQLEQQARLVITDSGGVQKEAFFFKKPCIILRAETEWVEIVEGGAAILCDADPTRIQNAYIHLLNNDRVDFPALYGDGTAAEQMLNKLLAAL
ncbi:non-hydrolyzing UDP-N-acetylglucosamine 2-epimerase [Spirosoma fluviale]|uniref:UDP-GlcNAc3NAcA epimerase n=1 Tax=Spirosoma fluviale TaxID=1597977 RepID=A0A286FDV8_9BACT|nr:UDP-N-acetylglucosamine 2-epimerase (non-hydrolyzing) [Spirosoma fluviale]SOD81286.1 UDP-GlcNAc3NAcA epimerase [Spirosoma fluviale]